MMKRAGGPNWLTHVAYDVDEIPAHTRSIRLRDQVTSDRCITIDEYWARVERDRQREVWRSLLSIICH